MNKQSFSLVLITSCLFIFNGTSAEETSFELSVEDMRNVVQSIRSVEDALLNIRIDSNCWVEQGPSLSGPWERTPVCFSTTAFFEKISSRKARIDFHKSVGPWENGAAQYFEESYSVSFDGVQGRRKAISSSYSGKTFDRDRGSILPEAPLELTGCGRITGIEASLFFHFRNPPEGFPATFSTHFAAAADPNYYLSVLAAADPNYLNIKPGVKFKAVLEEFRGVQCIKMAYIGNSLIKEWWLDPSRGFALLRHNSLGEDQDGNEQLKSSINVTKLKEVAENIWWPMEAYFVYRPYGIDEPWKRVVYRATNVVANDPSFIETIFIIHFPDGYLIDDRVAGKKYRVGEDPNDPKN